ncbi:hypothetical protein H5410_045904 [Solanum commersonii]|uniref:Uncharacterized protein n=1 Tax=Solanum commersonii TaxID=4109 RepID=A0A9J5XE41_SOLCO|nr:hypothetical protein H5410_045904 [Solanum commersonii]
MGNATTVRTRNTKTIFSDSKRGQLRTIYEERSSSVAQLTASGPYVIFGLQDVRIYHDLDIIKSNLLRLKG